MADVDVSGVALTKIKSSLKTFQYANAWVSSRIFSCTSESISNSNIAKANTAVQISQLELDGGSSHCLKNKKIWRFIL